MDLTQLFRRMGDLWWRGDTTVATLCSVLSALMWAGCLAFPGDTLARPTYAVMAFIAPEVVWICVFVSMAALQIWRLYTRSNKQHMRLEYCIKLSALTVWAFVAFACMFAQYPPAAAVSDTMVVAALTAWDFLRYEPCRLCSRSAQCRKVDCPHDS